MRRGFRFRMMTAILIVAVVGMFVFALESYSTSKSSIEQNYVKSLDEKMTLQIRNFDDVMQEMYQQVQHAGSEEELISCIGRYMNGNRSYAEGTEVAQKLSDILSFYRFGSTFYLYLPESGKIFSSRDYYAVRDAEDESISFFGEEVRNPFTPLCRISRMGTSPGRVFAYTQPVKNEAGEQLGVVCLTVEERQIYYSLLDYLNNTAGEEYLLLEPDGTICSAADLNRIGHTVRELGTQQQDRMNAKTGTDGLLYTSVEAPFSGYRILCQSDLKGLTTAVREKLIYLVLIALLVLMGLIFTAAILVQRLYRPIKELTDAIDHVGGGDFTARVEERSVDEFGVVRAHFNEMVSRMDEMMEQVVTERTQKREAEINALQYQIRPHFMYNTLNSIRFAATLQKNDKLAALLGDFIALLEASAQRKGAFIPLKEEVQLVQNYLSLQAFRYFDCFETQFSIAPETEDCYVPCLLLQPMVENAVFHGIDPKRNDNQIKVRSWLEQEKLHISIQDNGQGYLAEPDEPSHGEEDKHRFTGIGLKNVEQRLRLYYGDAAGFAIHSELKVGTTVEFYLPISRNEQEYSTKKGDDAE